MTAYNTGNPIGSKDPRDLYDNAENFDNAVNATGATFTDRLGVSRKTWKGLEDDAAAAIQSIESGGKVYETTAAGLAATVNGEYFNVPSVDTNGFITLYRNVSGSAVEIKQYPSSGYVARLNASVAALEERVYQETYTTPLLDNDLNGFEIDFHLNGWSDIVKIKQNGIVTLHDVDDLFENSSNGPNLITTIDGEREYSPHNFFLNSDAPATQSFANALVGFPYTISITGGGSVSIRSSLGDGNINYGVASESAPLTIIAQTVNIRIASITGTVNTIQLARGNKVLKYIKTTSAARMGIVISRNPNTGEMALLSEPTRTNYFLNSDAPATQTISLAASTYTVWLEGSGLIELSGGPIATVTEAEPHTFTLSGTTNVTFTVSGTVTFAQCENGETKTSPIITLSAARSRSINRASCLLSKLPPLNDSFLVYTDFTITKKASGKNSYIFSIGKDTSNLITYYQDGINHPTIRHAIPGDNKQQPQSFVIGENVRQEFTGVFMPDHIYFGVDGKPIIPAQTFYRTSPELIYIEIGGYANQPPPGQIYTRRFAAIPKTDMRTRDGMTYFYEYGDEDYKYDDYDVIVVAGQSNNLAGTSINPTIDLPPKRSVQLSLTYAANFGTITGNVFGNIYPAGEPMRHMYVVNGNSANNIGYLVAMAREYYVPNVARPFTKLMLINTAVGNTGFSGNAWGVKKSLYNCLCNNVGVILKRFPNAKLRLLCWMQGEYDSAAGMNPADYQAALDAQMADFRDQFGEVPIVIGGMRPAIVNANPDYRAIQTVLADTPNRLSICGYADPEAAPAIGTSNSTQAEYTAAELRLFAERFYNAFIAL